MSSGTITVVGEAIVDLTGGADGRTYRADPGGSPANVAVGLARLGVPVTLVTGLGDDAFGRLITRHLTESDVRVAAEPAAFTGMAVVTVDDAGVPAYDFALAWEPGRVTIPPGSAALHTGSLAAALGDGPAHVEALMSGARATATVSYDPNVRPAFLGDLPSERARVERQVALSDLVKASEEDLAWLYPGADPLDVARTWRDEGPALVVITHGARGATVIGAAGTIDRPAPVVAVADTVGAGDAFMAALLAGLASEDLLGAQRRDALAAVRAPALAGLLERAVLAAAMTCTRPGADPPTIAELDDTGPAQVS